MITPRPYQIEATNAVMKRRRAGVTRQLVNIPTGVGKTIIAAMVIARLGLWGGRALFLAHRDELLRQAVDKIGLVIPSPSVGIFKAKEREGLERDICVASIQTAARHTDLLRDRGFNLCICDEAHHATADSYTKVFDELGFMDGNLNKLLMGLTATAFRGDGGALGSVFHEIVYERSILDMIKAGYLCDVRGVSIGTDICVDEVHTRSGDFATDELAVAVDIPRRNAMVAEAYLQHCPGKKAVAFGVSVQHAQNIAKAFQDRGIPCGVVWGGMDEDARRGALEHFKSGAIKVLSNCLLLTEGFDAPDIEAVLMSRPTKSQGLYIQIAGRGLRTSPGKTECLLLDFVDVAQKHSLCGIATLAMGENVKLKNGQSFIESMQEAEEQMRGITAPLRRATQVVDLFGRSRFTWMSSWQNYRLSIGNDQAIVCSPTWEGGYDVYLVEANGMTTQLSRVPLPKEYALGVAEDYARKHAQEAFIDKYAAWRRNAATAKQLDLLAKMGMPITPNITKGEAQQMIGAAFNEPPTEKQLYCIRVNGLHPNPAILTKKEARVLIGQYYDRRAGVAV